MGEGWSGDLDEALERIAGVATGRGGIHVLRGGHRLAMGLPEDPKAARVVLDFYHPQRLKGRLFRLAGLAMVNVGIHRRVLSSHHGSGEPAVEWLREAAAEGRVGFLGCNPSHGLRCVVGGIEGGPAAAPFVAKLGFDGSRAAIVREAEVLQSLDGRPGVLKLLSIEIGEDWALMRLPHLGCRAPKDMEDPVVVDLLRKWLSEEKVLLGEISWAADLLDRAEKAGADEEWCEAMRGREVRSALVHGDFAVWNLRNLSTGPCALDWEWAVEDGVGGIDLAYGLRQEALLVRRVGAGEAVRDILGKVEGGAFGEYLDDCGWKDAREDWLKLGLWHSHLNVGQDSGEMLRKLGMNMERGFVTR